MQPGVGLITTLCCSPCGFMVTSLDTNGKMQYNKSKGGDTYVLLEMRGEV